MLRQPGTQTGNQAAATYDELEHLFSGNESDSLHARPRCAAAFICERIGAIAFRGRARSLALKHAKHVCIPVYGSCSRCTGPNFKRCSNCFTLNVRVDLAKQQQAGIERGARGAEKCVKQVGWRVRVSQWISELFPVLRHFRTADCDASCCADCDGDCNCECDCLDSAETSPSSFAFDLQRQSLHPLAGAQLPFQLCTHCRVSHSRCRD